MLWTAPPPARECHECGCLLTSHDSEELSTMQAITTIGFRHRQVGFSGPRYRCGGQCGYPPAVEAPLRPGVL